MGRRAWCTLTLEWSVSSCICGLVMKQRQFFACGRLTSPSSCPAQPNMRLKLAGLSFLKESERLCPGEHELSFNDNAPCDHVARSLSAIR